MDSDLTQKGQVTLTPFGTMAASSSTGVSSFNLESFYFGCVLNTENDLASPATGCVFAVTGYNIYDEEVPVATFAFAPSVLFQAPLALAELPSTFTKLINVTFGVAAGSVIADGTIPIIDNVVHCNY